MRVSGYYIKDYFMIDGTKDSKRVTDSNNTILSEGAINLIWCIFGNYQNNLIHGKLGLSPIGSKILNSLYRHHEDITTEAL